MQLDCELCEDQGFMIIESEKVYCSCEIGKSVKEFDEVIG